MIYYRYYNNFNDSNNSKSLIGFTFNPDGSFLLDGDATVWNDQITNSIKDFGTIDFDLVNQEFSQEIPYGNIDDKIWVKVNIPKNKSITVTFTIDATKQPDNDAVFEFYDDFDENNLDTSKWDSYGSYTLNDGYINFSVNGKGIVSKKTFREPFVIKSKLYYSGSGWFDHIYGIGNDNKGTWWTIINGTVQDFDWVNATNTHSYGGNYTNNHCLLSSGDYEVEIGVSPHYVIINNNKFTKKHLSGYTNPGKIAIANYSANAAKWDWIYVRKYIEQLPSVQINQISDTQYQVIITNDTSKDIEETQIPIELPTDKTYKVETSSSTPILTCKAFPNNTNSYITFYTQFNHQVKFNSECAFHIHTYIPPDAPNGNVKFKFEWMKLPVEMITDGSSIIHKPNINKVLKEITKTFTITDEMKGKHIILNFGKIDIVNSLSQIVFHKLERLATDNEDTFEYQLPYLYIDWHTEINSIGSQDEFKK